jgi:hypothetical protein
MVQCNVKSLLSFPAGFAFLLVELWGIGRSHVLSHQTNKALLHQATEPLV